MWFLPLARFFKVVVIDGNDERLSGRSIDLEKVKLEEVRGKRGRVKEIRQRNVWEIIEYIKSGEYQRL